MGRPLRGRPILILSGEYRTISMLEDDVSDQESEGQHDASLTAARVPDLNRSDFQRASFEGLQDLAPAIVKVWRIKSGLFSAVLVIIAVVLDILNLFDSDKLAPFGVIPLVVLAIALFFALWIPRLRYKYWGYDLRAQELLLVRGILNRVHTIIPLRRIQHLDVSQDIFEREFEVGKLIIHTAGTRSSDVILPGLSIDVAEKLRDEMKEFITDEAL